MFGMANADAEGGIQYPIFLIPVIVGLLADSQLIGKFNDDHALV